MNTNFDIGNLFIQLRNVNTINSNIWRKEIAGDIVAVIRYLLSKNEESITSALIDKRIVSEIVDKTIFISEDAVFSVALHNTTKIFEESVLIPFDNNLYLVTNEEMMNGATTIIYPGVLDAIRNNYECNFYIIPSSTDEIITFPDDGNLEGTIEDVEDIIGEVNSRFVLSDHILSDKLYYYNGSRIGLASELKEDK